MEFNEEFALKYGLKKDEDYWFHKPSSHWIVKHDACVKIADQESIRLMMGRTLESSDTHKSVIVHGVMGEANVEMVGECHVGMQPISKEYPWCLAQKRGEDRCILRLVAPGGGIYSEIEADDFKDTGSSPAPEPVKQSQPDTSDVDIPSDLKLPDSMEAMAHGEDEVIGFGKHKGRKWGDVKKDDPGYLEWMVKAAIKDKGNDFSSWSRNAITSLHLMNDDNPGEIPF